MSEPSQIHTTLQDRFGFSDFRAGQIEVIQALLGGNSAAAVFPTGAGKSLCYQLPALLLPGVTLVVSPLLALMKDQVDALTNRGIAAARLDSTLSVEEYQSILEQAREGHLKLLYVAPERFQNERFREALSQLSISLFAIDEAHCVSEWGHNFRPDYLKLKRAAEGCRAERILALTATATPRVLDDICRTFAIEHRVRTPFHRPNLILGSRLAGNVEEKLRHLKECLTGGPTVVYVTLQKSAEELAATLQEWGIEARAYHAGLDPELRAETQDWFLSPAGQVVVATIAFGMGIDKPDIRTIIHFDPPKSLEGYSQEIGRAGRDGDDSVCTFIYHAPDRIPLENFVHGDTPTGSALQRLLEHLFCGESELVLNLYQLGNDCDIRPLVLRTILTYLELEGFLEERTPVYSSYQLKPSVTSQEILDALQGEPRDFLAGVFRQAVKKRVWLHIDLEQTAEVMQASRERVIRALDWCEQKGWMEIRASDLRHRYRVLQAPPSLLALAQELEQRALQREQGEVGRLSQVISLATHPGCLAARLSEHFGESLPSGCGRCSDCTRETELHPIEHPVPDFLLPQLPSELSEPRLAARFLCGVSSPYLSKGGWHRDRRFGSLANIPFLAVLERLKIENKVGF